MNGEKCVAIDDTFAREVGWALLSWIAATRAGRWAGPRGALDYLKVNDRGADGLVADFVAWSSGHAADLRPDAISNMQSLAAEMLDVTMRRGDVDALRRQDDAA